MRLRRWSLVLLAAAPLVVGARAGTDDSESIAAYRKARDELVPKLRALVAWCDAGQFFQERNCACEAVLAFEPDDEAARRTLHYSRGKDGRWTRGLIPKSSPPDAEHAAAVAAKHEDAFAEFRAAALRLVDDADAPTAGRERALDELIGVEPDCTDARAADREELVGGRWLLQETALAKRRRRELVEAIDAAKKACGPATKSGLAGDEASLASWSDVREIGPLRVLAGPNVPEAEAAARAGAVVLSTCRETTGRATPTTGRLRLYLFADKTEGLAAVARDKRLTADDRAWATELTTFPVPMTDDTYIWSHDPGARVEAAMRCVVGECLWRMFFVKSKPVWAREGTCHWYSEILLGTHDCYFMKRTEYGDAQKEAADLHKRLFSDGSDWLAEARALEKSPRWPDLRLSLARDASTATSEDALVAYCLARYLIEGRPEKFGDVMRAVGAAKTSPDLVAATLDATVEGLDRRLRRWVRETR